MTRKEPINGSGTTRKPTRPLGRLPIVLVAMLAASAFVGLAGVVAAHEGTNHGTIKVHDDETASPPKRNEPHVSCDFWIEGFKMAGDSGRLVFTSWPPTGDRTVVLTDEWTGEDEENGKGSHFTAGPYQLDAGHYRVDAYLDQGHPGNEEHQAKSKMFWVEPCPVPADELPCPTGLSAVANGDGTIDLHFEPAPGSDGTNVYRAEGSGEFVYQATVAEGVATYHDASTSVGTTYTYTVTGAFGDRESTDCETVEVTAIPEFPTFAAVGLAAIGGTFAYAVMRRRGP